ncbi:MAG TPA: zeta toxin family protein [Acidimicrobiia bacterium]|nr:zeta toxin family protein [Acidimicrobiia bacterium]
MSRLDLIAGPNGAGKTTLYERVIAPDRPGLPFVDADRIASDRFPGHEVEQAHAASEIAATARNALVEARLDFCTETVFSHRSKVDLVTIAAAAGYDVVLHVVMIPLALSGPRVAARVASGGHDVPADKLEPRYTRLWPNVVAAMPHCRRAVFYDNAADDGPSEVAAFRLGVADYSPRWPRWTPEPLLAL